MPYDARRFGESRHGFIAPRILLLRFIAVVVSVRRFHLAVSVRRLVRSFGSPFWFALSARRSAVTPST
jgi:hypothetical protein